MGRLSLTPMDISLRWLNQYLTPGDVIAEQVDRIRAQVGDAHVQKAKHHDKHHPEPAYKKRQEQYKRQY